MITCYGCGERILNSQALRRNVKVAGNTVFAYDVVCPYCHLHIGRVLWGRYTENPRPPQTVAQEFAPNAPQETPPGSHERHGVNRRSGDRRSADRRRSGPLVLQLSYRGRERRSGERRGGDRRLHTDKK